MVDGDPYQILNAEEQERYEHHLDDQRVAGEEVPTAGDIPTGMERRNQLLMAFVLN